MTKLLLIALGGSIGTMLRYGVQSWLNDGSNLPLGTLAVNITGCLFIGFLASAWTIEPVMVREEYRMAVLIGLLGGFTTFSAFGLETNHLLDSGKMLHAFLNITLSVGAGLTATWAGARAAAWFYSQG